MPNQYNVLIIEDENSIASFMTTILNANKYEVTRAKSGAEAFMMINSGAPDIILLDLGLPDIDGMTVIRSVRAWTQLPIIVVSARSGEREKVAALDSGADDYITKPFGTSELLARIRTALRHNSMRTGEDASGLSDGCISCGALTVDCGKRRVFLDGKDVGMTQNEFRIVELLAKNAGRVLTYDFLIRTIWGPYGSGDNQILRVNMANIRRKIEINTAEPVYIFTEMGVGYRMVDPAEI